MTTSLEKSLEELAAAQNPTGGQIAGAIGALAANLTGETPPADGLDSTLAELERTDTPSGGLIAKAFAGIADLLKAGRRGREEPEDEDDLDALLDEYGVDDDPEDDLDDDAEGATPPPRRARKSFADALEEDGYGEVIAGDQFIKSVLDEADARAEERDRQTRSEVRRLRKAVTAMAQQQTAMAEALTEIGTTPTGPLGRKAPYTMRKAVGEGAPAAPGIPAPDVLLRKADAGVMTGQLTPAEAQTIRVAASSGDAAAAASLMPKLAMIPDNQ